jgi:hypothetical protein
MTLVLSNWHVLVSTNGGKLALALEADARMAEVLNRYLQTGDLEPVLDFWLPYNSMDYLEFCGNLRRFVLRLGETNRHLPEDRKISFRVLGLETPSPLSATNLTAADLPQVWQAGLVANERDRHSANNLMANLRAQPTERVLLFYGDMHLSIRQVSKSWATRVFGSTDRWQPLGFRLRSELGTNFLSIAQVQFPRSVRSPESPYHALTRSDILVNASDIPWRHDRIEPADYDAVVLFSATSVDEAHLLKYLCSHRVLDQAIKRLALLEQLPQNAFTARHSVLSSTLEGLRFITGQQFANSAEWTTWAKTNAYDGFARVNSPEFAEAIRIECGRPRKGPMLASLGLPMPIAFRSQGVTSEQWSDVWPKVQPTVCFLQCLGIYWVGYPDEKATAQEYLVKFSGKNFEWPADYLQWFRMNRLGLAY